MVKQVSHIAGCAAGIGLQARHDRAGPAALEAGARKTQDANGWRVVLTPSGGRSQDRQSTIAMASLRKTRQLVYVGNDEPGFRRERQRAKFAYFNARGTRR